MTDRLHSEGAILSADRRYRYALSRKVKPVSSGFVEPPRCCAFVLLNPSTASESEDDPTVRKCRGFAERWGFPMFDIVNLFALRATDPDALRLAVDPGTVGVNDDWIMAVARHAAVVVAGWGNHGELYNRGQRVRAMLQGAGIPLHCWEITKANQPKHPLYVPYAQPLQLVPVRGVA
jgi:hypothetical protein